MAGSVTAAGARLGKGKGGGTSRRRNNPQRAPARHPESRARKAKHKSQITNHGVIRQSSCCMFHSRPPSTRRSRTRAPHCTLTGPHADSLTQPPPPSRNQTRSSLTQQRFSLGSSILPTPRQMHPTSSEPGDGARRNSRE